MPATGENEIDPKDRNKEIRIVMGEDWVLICLIC